jgi:hypothetical protein
MPEEVMLGSQICLFRGQKTKTPEGLLLRRSCFMHIFVPFGITMAFLIFRVGDAGLEPATPAV